MIFGRLGKGIIRAFEKGLNLLKYERYRPSMVSTKEEADYGCSYNVLFFLD